MAHTTPTVQDGWLTTPTQTRPVPLESADWWCWLTAADSRSFRFVHPQGKYTARRESIHGQVYWYAYRRRQGKLHKTYLGKAEDLTSARLVQAAVTLTERTQESTTQKMPHPTFPVIDPALAVRARIPYLRVAPIKRPRLHAQVKQVPGGVLLLVVAPAGAGKTTLLITAAAHQGTAAWVSLEPGDNDPARFWTLVIAALQLCLPGIGQAALAALQPAQPPGWEALPMMLIDELNDRHHKAEQLCTLILDDYHLVEREEVHRGITILVEYLPPTLRLVLASRTTPPLPLARWRARRHLMEIQADNLRFTSAETHHFLQHVVHLNLSPQAAATLAERTEGWAVGLQLAGLTLQKSDDPAAALDAFGGGHRAVFDYLAQEVLNHQPESVQAFLLETALLDHLSGSLCDAVTGRDDSYELLAWLERANLFLVPLDDQRHWYRYHHLFREFLAARARQMLPASSVRTLHQRAAAWYAAHGSVAPAVEHAFAAADLTRAADLVEQTARALWMRSEALTLLAWIERLPEPLVRSRPLLNLCTAWALLATARLDAAEQRLQMVEQALQVQPLVPPADVVVLQGELAVLRASLARMQDNADEALHWSQQALTCLPPDAVLLRGVTMLNLGHAHRLRGAMGDAAEAMQEAIALSRACGNLHIVLHGLSALALVQIVQGRLHHAYATCRETIRLACDQHQQQSSAVALARIRMADVLREWNRLAEADAAVTSGIALGRQVQNSRIVHAGAIVLARVRQAQGDLDGAAAALAAAHPIAEQMSRHLPSDFVHAWVVLWLMRGEYDRIDQWVAERGLDLPNAASLALSEPEVLLLARIALARGDPTTAHTLLEPLLHDAETGQRVGRLLLGLVIQCVAYQMEQNTPQALQVLERAVSLARVEGYVRLFLDDYPSLVELLLLLYRRIGQRNAYLRQLLLAAGRLPDKEQQMLNEPLTLRERQVLRLLAAGQPNQAIAETLSLAPSTIKWHLRNLYAKLGVQNRTQAVSYAHETGLFGMLESSG